VVTLRQWSLRLGAHSARAGALRIPRLIVASAIFRDRLSRAQSSLPATIARLGPRGAGKYGCC